MSSVSTNASNRTSYTATITSTQNTTYAYDAANRLVNVAGVAYTWDDLGRLTSDGTYSFTWDAASRLITVTGGGVTVGFRYDGDGNRLAQIGDGTLTTHTLDIGLALPEVLARQGSGWSELYVHLPNAVATKEGTAWRYGAADGLGSVRQELDSSEDVDAVNSYRPFGLPLEGDGGDPYGFTGEWWDGSEDRGLLFLRARYHEPKAGRFLSPDTIVPNYAYPPSIHRYSYVHNNAVNYTDPSGHRTSGPGDPDRDEINELLQQYRYVRTENSGWIDFGHAWPRSEFVQRLRAAAKTGGEMEVPGPLFEFHYYAYYWVERLDEDQIEGVAMGIYGDFSRRQEEWQGGFALGQGADSSFALEDLPSNYIGLLIALRNPYHHYPPTTADSAKFVLDYLDPAEWTNQPPLHSGDVDCHSVCDGLMEGEGYLCWLYMQQCHNRWHEALKNYDFTPRIEIAPGNYANVAWPCDDLVIQPISSGPDTWHFLREEHDRHPWTYAKVALNKLVRKIEGVFGK